jgi:dipeptidase D
MTFVSELEPRDLWTHFDTILTIPRGSKNERQVIDYVLSVANRYSLESEQDTTGNIVVRKPATVGGESRPPIILQSHLDMVNESNSDVSHDFLKDPLIPCLDGEYLKATGTTLGSDNGIGVSASLTLMGNMPFTHGPLEFLFTVDEETGLTGAAELSSDFLQGRHMINLDTEERGAIYVGCAGGSGMDIKLPIETGKTKTTYTGLNVWLSGLQGGHSGVDIHLQRGNAIKLLARALGNIDGDTFRLGSIEGGNMHNAIPREAHATLALNPDSVSKTQSNLVEAFHQISDEFRPADPFMTWSIEAESLANLFLTRSMTKRVLDLIQAIPHGVTSMSYDIPNLVETSSNLAKVRRENDNLIMHVSTRSSSPSALDALQGRIRSICDLSGSSSRQVDGYPGWKPDLTSKLLQVARGVFEKQMGSPPEVKAIHAGLECGLIGEKYNTMDMISIGPQIEFPHSPDERVHIGSVKEFFSVLKGILSESK